MENNMTFPPPTLRLLLVALFLTTILLIPACGGEGPIGNGEICGDGIDNDNDGAIDEGADEDGDTYRDCDIPALIDCDDEDPNVNPAADEACDQIDNDCDGEVDNVDLDGDGYVSDSCYGSDCDDADPDAYPGRPESCDGADNDCDGEIDDGFDADDDGWTSCMGDCNNADGLINPEAEELCDFIDNNCNNKVDETYDLDEDGYIGWSGAFYAACADIYGPGGQGADLGDCDDDDPFQWPGAHESPDNGEDDDCDGCTDECDDGDGDCYDNCSPGDSGDPTCEVPGQSGGDADGFEADCDDCADPTNIQCLFAGTVHPDTIFEVPTSDGPVMMDELCDGVDNDCDGEVDEGYDPVTCDPL
jgi:hypothetical protein